jgi:hypothetical protein
MRSEGDRRWRLLSQTLRSALIQHDIVGSRGISLLPHGDKTLGFAVWLREEIRQKVFGMDGRWLRPFVRLTALSAQRRANDLTETAGHAESSRWESMESLAISELRGICEAAQQQLVRSVAHSMMRGATPTQTANATAAIIKAMRDRTRAMSEYVVAKTHATTTLSTFRSSGVERVGVVPERLRKRRRLGDAPKKTGPGSRLRGKAPSPRTIGRIEEVQQELEESLGGDEVDVVTAGDDNVCEECQDISDGGPYDLDEAEDLIPAHPYCRCAFAPAGKYRDALLSDDREGHEFHGNQYTGGRGGGKPDTPHHQEQYKSFHVKTNPVGGAEMPTAAQVEAYIRAYEEQGRTAPSSSSRIDPSTMVKVGGAMGSNKGGVYRDNEGNRYYVKEPKTEAHVTNERSRWRR